MPIRLAACFFGWSVEKQSLYYIISGDEKCTYPMGEDWTYLIQLNMHLRFYLAFQVLGIFPRICSNTIKILSCIYIATMFIIAKD